MTIADFLNNTDYRLLLKQKQTLLNILDPDAMNFPDPDRMTHLDGLINFLDAFQDAAVESGLPEEKVFPRPEVLQ